jgi:hypothetical protein
VYVRQGSYLTLQSAYWLTRVTLEMGTQATPVLSWELFGSACTTSNVAQDCLCLSRLLASISKSTKSRETELLLVGYNAEYTSEWQSKLTASATGGLGEIGPLSAHRASSIHGKASSFNPSGSTALISFESFHLTKPPSSWAPGVLVEILVTLKSENGGAVHQFPPMFWLLASSDNGFSVCGLAPDQVLLRFADVFGTRFSPHFLCILHFNAI